MNEAVRKSVQARGIRRLCHFTPSRNLQHIAAGNQGVLSTAALKAAERQAFNPTDLERLDQKTTHICCSIEFPNGWYFSIVRGRETLFPDWVVLLLSPSLLWQDETLFCPRNAAAGYGRHVVKGIDGFESLFANQVQAGDRSYRRTGSQRAATPTDQQAEVLVHDRIAPADILAVAVQSEHQAKTERARLRVNGIDPDIFPMIIAPYMFDKFALSGAIKAGSIPKETPYPPVVGLTNG